MDDWISDLLIFSAGVTGGILVSIIVSFLRTNQRQRTDLAATRTRILADIKEQHEQEMLHAAVRTAEDIRGELHQSALTLQKALLAARAPMPPIPEEPRDHTADVEWQAQSS
jgi:hypothetical protein